MVLANSEQFRKLFLQGFTRQALGSVLSSGDEEKAICMFTVVDIKYKLHITFSAFKVKQVLFEKFLVKHIISSYILPATSL